MLQEVEDPRPLFAMDEDEFSPVHDNAPADMFSNGNSEGHQISAIFFYALTFLVSTSYVVTNPMMDRRDLPIIGTPPVTDDLETPLVEENPINGNFIHETATNNYAISENIIIQPEEKTATVNKTPEMVRNKSPGAKPPPSSQESIAQQQQQEKREKKQRVCLFYSFCFLIFCLFIQVSLREMITAPPPKPVQIEKPKKVSKQQQLMEQILNNMKEQKDVPKKEKSTRPKLSDLWSQPPPPPPPSAKIVENDGKVIRSA